MIGEKLGQLKTREKVGLILALSLVALVLVDRLAVQVVVQQIQQVEDRIRTETQQLEHHLAVIAAEPVVRAQYETVQPLLGTASSESAAMDRLKGRIDELARRHGLNIQTMRDRAPGDEETPWLRVAVEVSSFEAGIEELIGFLFAIRQEPHVWRVERLNIGAPTNGRLNGAMIIAQITERHSNTER